MLLLMDRLCMLMEGEQLGHKKKVLITPEGMSILSNQFDNLFGSEYEITFTNGIISNQKELTKLLKDKNACIIGSEKLTEATLKQCKSLEIISRFGSGYDSISLDALRKFNIKLSISPSISVKSVARHTLALFLSLTNNILQQKKSSLIGKWDRTLNLSPQYTIVGLIGMGPIAQEFAKYLVNLGFKVCYYSRSRKENMDLLGLDHFDTIDKVLHGCDIVSMHLKLVEETKNIADSSFFQKMAGGLFINTARGGLVNESDLYEALENGILSGAALDVYRHEPAIGLSSQIQKMENVVSTCHVSSYDYHSLTCVGRDSISNITNYFNNKPRNLINLGL